MATGASIKTAGAAHDVICYMPFAYSLLVNLPANRRLGYDEAELAIDWQGRSVVIKPMGDAKPIREAEWLKFTCRDFADGESARAHGQSLKGHLRLAAVKSHIPFNVGRERVISAAYRTVLDNAAAQGIQLLPSVHGLMVYEQTADDRQLWAVARGIASTPHNALLECLRAVVNLSTPSDDSRLALACELYSQALFETSRAAQFISLVTAIESLIERDRQPQAVQDVLKEAETTVIPRLKQLTAVDDSMLQSVMGRFRDLSRESISQAFRHLATAYGDPAGYGDTAETPGRFAARAYNLRSKLVHGDVVADPLPLASLMQLVADIILGLAATDSAPER